MNLPLSHRVLTMRPLLSADAETLLGTARALKRAAQAGIAQPLLQGKNIVVHCTVGEDAAGPVALAATALGARVARLQLDTALLEAGAEGAAEVARMLARLYDAVGCERLPPAAAAHLQRELGIPVYSGLTGDDHPLRALAPAVGGGAAPADDTSYLVQALLVNTVTA